MTHLGARIGPAGCSFRVWAPHPVAVSVLLQDGERWEAGAPTHEWAMARDGDHWSTTVPGVGLGRLYRFRLAGPDGSEVVRLDPAARDVLSSELTRDDPGNHNAAVVTTSEFPWSPFVTPRFEDFLIYQLHVGTFAGRGDQLGVGWAGFRDVETKLGYVRDLGFTCVELLPVHEFAMDRSWGYNPASLFAPESSYGSPDDLRRFVDAAHRHGLAVIFDVVHNHMGDTDNVLQDYDGWSSPEGGIYFEGGRMTSWGRGPAWWKREVQELYHQNARMYLQDYRADGLRFDATTQINGLDLAVVVGRLRAEFPSAYLVAEHLPDHPWIVDEGRFCATWCSRAHQETQRALAGVDPVTKVASFLNTDGYDQPWNLVTYLLGSHDDIGDLENGDAEHGLSNWDSRHRYLIDQLGGRDDPGARARCRLAWALNIAAPGTPMLFMGSECHMGAPTVGWGYWTDGADEHGDHRFDWAVAGDPTGIPMRRLVAAANAVRRENRALRTGSTTITHRDDDNQVLGFVREIDGATVLAVVNLGGRTFGSYGVDTGGRDGAWTQLLCTQDAAFGGWDGAGNAYAHPRTQPDGRVYLNLPATSVLLLRRDPLSP